MPRNWYQPQDAVGTIGSVGAIDAEPAPARSPDRHLSQHYEWWRPGNLDGQPQDTRAVVSGIGTGSAAPFWSLMFFTAIMLFSPQQYFPALAPLRPALLAAGLGILSYLLDRMRRRLPIVEWTWELKLIAGLVAWAVVTVPFSLWPGGTISVLLDQFAKTVIVFWLLSHVVTTSDRLRQVAWVLTGIAVILGFLSAYNYLTGAIFVQGVEERLIGTEGGLTKNPNDLALMINLIVPLTIALLVSTHHAVKRNLVLLAIGVEILTVGLTYSRGGAVTLGVIVVACIWKFRGRAERRWLYGLLFVGLMALPFAPSSYSDRLATITNIDADRTGSAQERWADMVVALKTVIANPIVGAGMGMNMLAMREERGGWLPVHNVYLEHGLDLGLPGLLLFLALLAACYKATVDAQRQCRACGRDDTGALAEGLQVSLIAFATAAMFHPVSYHMYFYYMAGLAVAVGKLCSTGSRQMQDVAA